METQLNSTYRSEDPASASRMEMLRREAAKRAELSL
jgi:hypothetical protein